MASVRSPRWAALACFRQKNAPAVHTGRGIFYVLLIVGTDVHEAQTAPGHNVLVAISADVVGRAAVEATVAAPMPAVTIVPAVHAMPAVATMTMMPTMTTMTTGRGGHSGSTERDSGGDGE
jgi:hypothetical protein